MPNAPLPQPLRRMLAYKYPVFTGAYNLNCVLERNPDPTIVSNDWCSLWYQTKRDDTWHGFAFACTIDPGLRYREHPMNAKGAARLAFGRYPGMWAPGLHRGRPGLVQVKPTTVERADPTTGVFAEQPPRETGLFGIDMHSGGIDASAGCTTVGPQDRITQILDLLAEQGRNGHGNGLTVVVMPLD